MPFGYIGQNQTKQKVKNTGVLSSFDISLLEKQGHAGGSIELIESQTYSSTVTAVDFTSIKEDIYDVHYLQIQNSGNVTDNRRLTCRFFEGGVLETAGVYHIATQVGTSAGTFSDVKGTTENEMRLCDNTGGNSAGEKANVYAYFYNLGNSSKYSLMLSQSIVGNNSGTAAMEFGGGYLPQASTVDGIRVLINDDSSFDSFTMTLYGMKQL